MAIFYVRPVAGNDANTGASIAQAVKTVEVGRTKLTTAGDELKVENPYPKTTVGSCLWTDASSTVTVPAGTFKEIYNCNGAWTASANVTCSTNTGGKEGSVSTQTMAAGFTTGLVCYKALGSTFDLSGYQQISLWFKITTANVAAGTYELRLCSDAAGVTAVDTFSLPATTVLGILQPSVYDKLAALGSAIQSIAIYRTANVGAQVLQIDNIYACLASANAASVTHQSLISKDTAAEPDWYPIRALNEAGSSLTLDNDANSVGTSVRPYYGVTETVTTYKQETVKTALAAASTTAITTLALAGTTAARNKITGGWEATFTTQTGFTFLDGLISNGHGMNIAVNYTAIERMGFVRYNHALSISGFGNDNTDVMCVGCSGGLSSGSPGSRNTRLRFVQGGTTTTLSHLAAGPSVYTDCAVSGSLGNGLNGFYGEQIWQGGRVVNCGNIGFNANLSFINFFSTTFDRNVGADVNLQDGVPKFTNCLMGSSTEVAFTASTSVSQNMAVWSHNHDTTVGFHKAFFNGGLVQTDVSTVLSDGSTGTAWKLSPTATTRSTDYPIVLPVAKIHCAANVARTVNIKVKRDNTGVTSRFFARGRQLTGVASDLTATSAASANTWETLTLTFTPTEAGVMEFEIHAYGGTTFNAWCYGITYT